MSLSPLIVCVTLVAANEPRLHAELTPASTVAGETSTIGIELSAEGRVAASTGRVETRDGALILDIGADRAPRVVSIAVANNDATGAVFLIVGGRTDLPIEIAGRVSVEVTVGAQQFGPFETDGGKLEAPIIVMPGDLTAQVVATDNFGNKRTETVDLHPPSRSRLALVTPHREIPLEASTHVAIAYAHLDGTPGTERASVMLEAKRGIVGAVEFRGDGLWVATYRAPSKTGPDTMSVKVADGFVHESTAELNLTAVLPAVAGVELRFPQIPHEAGSTLVGEVFVRDINGFAITSIPPTLQSGDLDVEVSATTDGFTFAVPLPTTAGSSTLVATAGEARGESRVDIISGAPSSAELDVQLAGRSADLTIRVQDAHGNPVSHDRYQLRAEGARLSSEAPGTARIEADADIATVSLLAGEVVLVEREVQFPADRADLELGLRAVGGYWTNTGVLSGPRVGLGLGLRRDVGPVELALLVDAEYSRAGIETRAGELRVDHTVDVLAIPVEARVRYGVGDGVGMTAGLVVAASVVRSSSISSDLPDATTTGLRAAVRGVLGGDFALGPGRVVGQLSLGHATLPDDGFLTGTVERFAVVVGYEVWLLDLLD